MFIIVSKAMLTAGAVSLVLAGIIMTVTVIVCCRLRSKSKITSRCMDSYNNILIRLITIQ